MSLARKFKITVYGLAAFGLGVSLWLGWQAIRIFVHLLPFIVIGALVLFIAVKMLKREKTQEIRE